MNISSSLELDEEIAGRVLLIGLAVPLLLEEAN